jgi:hypothetical protein
VGSFGFCTMEELVGEYLHVGFATEGSGGVGGVGCDSLRLGEEIFGTDVVAGFEELVPLCFEFLGHGLCVSEALGFCDLFPNVGRSTV